MRFYIDSADLPSIESLMKTGVFHGVTTNPLILQAAGVRLAGLTDLAKRLFDLGAKELFLQSWGGDGRALYERGLQLARMDDTNGSDEADGRITVKLPATREGMEAAARLAKGGVRTCITAVYAPFQALLAASAGAAYAAPYLGRMNDAKRDGYALIARMTETLAKMESPCDILAASVRSVEDVAELAGNGVRCITLSPPVAEELFREPLTIEAAAAFEAAAKEFAG